MWFNNHAFTRVQFHLECVCGLSESASNSEDRSIHDQIAVRSEKTHEVSRCNQAQRECAGKDSLLEVFSGPKIRA